MRLKFLMPMLAIMGILAACSNPAPITPQALIVTPTPKIVVVTSTPQPRNTYLPTVTPLILETPTFPPGWETPPSEVILPLSGSALPQNLPSAAKFTEIVANRIFQFENPTGFRFSDNSFHSIMENKEQTIYIWLEVFDHKGDSNSVRYLNRLLEDFFKATSSPKQINLKGYAGWSVDIEIPNFYGGAVGQMIAIDLNDTTLFCAWVAAKPDVWESQALPIFNSVLDSLTFPGIE